MRTGARACVVRVYVFACVCVQMRAITCLSPCVCKLASAFGEDLEGA